MSVSVRFLCMRETSKPDGSSHNTALCRRYYQVMQQYTRLASLEGRAGPVQMGEKFDRTGGLGNVTDYQLTPPTGVTSDYGQLQPDHLDLRWSKTAVCDQRRSPEPLLRKPPEQRRRTTRRGDRVDRREVIYSLNRPVAQDTNTQTGSHLERPGAYGLRGLERNVQRTDPGRRRFLGTLAAVGGRVATTRRACCAARAAHAASTSISTSSARAFTRC